MIGSLPEFVFAVRKALDDKIAEQTEIIVAGKLLSHDSVETTALIYTSAAAFLAGLRFARTEVIDDLVKKMNEGGL